MHCFQDWMKTHFGFSLLDLSVWGTSDHSLQILKQPSDENVGEFLLTAGEELRVQECGPSHPEVQLCWQWQQSPLVCGRQSTEGPCARIHLPSVIEQVPGGP